MSNNVKLLDRCYNSALTWKEFFSRIDYYIRARLSRVIIRLLCNCNYVESKTLELQVVNDKQDLVFKYQAILLECPKCGRRKVIGEPNNLSETQKGYLKMWLAGEM